MSEDAKKGMRGQHRLLTKQTAGRDSGSRGICESGWCDRRGDAEQIDVTRAEKRHAGRRETGDGWEMCEERERGGRRETQKEGDTRGERHGRKGMERREERRRRMKTSGRGRRGRKETLGEEDA